MPPPLVQMDPMLDPIAPASQSVSTWDEALAMLRARSTDLRIALDEIERAEGQWREALSSSLPTITGTASITGNPARRACGGGLCTTERDALYWNLGVSLTQPLIAPRAWHAVKTADLQRDVAKLSAEDQKRLLTIALANAVVSVVTGERIAEINRVGLRAALDRLQLARRRVALGAGTALDTVRADQDVSVARASIVTGNESLRQARETLGLALGATEAYGVPADIDLNGLETAARVSCSTPGSLEERADVAAARTTTEVAKRNVDDARLRISPTLNLVTGYNGIGTFSPSASEHDWTIAGVLTVPFYDGGFRYGAVRDAHAQEDQAQQRLDALRRNATVQIGQARRSVEVAEQSRHVAEQARDLARETERLARVAFQAGTGTSLDLIDSGRRLREAESQLAVREFDLVQARIAALLALSRCHW